MRSFRVNLRGEHVILFLKQILRRIAGPIVLVWDNHPIHQRRLVQNFIEAEPRLHVYTFPACAPELNPIEFVWTHTSHATENFAPHDLSELSTKVCLPRSYSSALDLNMRILFNQNSVIEESDEVR